MKNKLTILVIAILLLGSCGTKQKKEVNNERTKS